MAVFSKLSEKISPRNSALITGSLLGIYLTYRNISRLRKRNRDGKEELKVVLARRDDKKERAAVDMVFFRPQTGLGGVEDMTLNCEVRGILLIFVDDPAQAIDQDIKDSCSGMDFNRNVVSSSRGDLSVFPNVRRCLDDSERNRNREVFAIIGRNMELFKKYVFRFIYAMPAISVVNNLLKYGLNELKLRFRTRLSTYLYDKYLKGFTYYKMSNLDNRISNPDQLLTQDVEKFCSSVAELYSNLSKPMLDIVIYTMKLGSSIGAQGPFIMLSYLAISGLILTRLRRPIGKLTVIEQRLEGEYRHVNSRLITNSEEIAFYQGNAKEHNIMMTIFQKLIDHIRNFNIFRMQMGIVDNIVAKYIATVVGYSVVSRPFMDLMNPRLMHFSHSELLEEYYKSGRMLFRMAEAIGRIVLAGREMTRLSGFTARVTELIQVLDDLNAGRYERTMVTTETNAVKENKILLKPGSGELFFKDHLIRFENVPLVTPNGDVLIRELNFEVQAGMNVVVCGPNGCGKSSLFRILGELWPLFGGKLTKPEKGKLFYIPQRPYMTLGTLRDQVIYPHSHQEQLNRGVTDRDLQDIITKVQLGYILEREGGWDSVQDWMDVLSGGEKQRIAMARLFYHKPQFAILDECTSAVSMDVEGYMYQHCRQVGITLFTVSHRKSLWKHHEYYLMMDGRGEYEFKPITEETLEFGS